MKRTIVKFATVNKLESVIRSMLTAVRQMEYSNDLVTSVWYYMKTKNTFSAEIKKKGKVDDGNTYRSKRESVLLLAHSRIFFFSQPSTVFTHSSPGLRQSFDMNGIVHKVIARDICLAYVRNLRNHQ